jgi:hypothetical protein
MQSIKLFSVYFIYCMVNLYSQEMNNFESMRTAFLMGLDSKGMDICHNIISNKSNPEREKSLFFIAEYFFSKSFEDSAYSVNKAYTFYTIYESDYKNGEYISVVKDRKNYLETFYSGKLQYVDYLNKFYNERIIVERKLKFLESMFNFNSPNPFEFYKNSDTTRSDLDLVIRYCDDIILNHPNFALLGYYVKTLAYLSQMPDINYIQNGVFSIKKYIRKPGLFENQSTTQIYNETVNNSISEAKSKVFDIMKILDDKYPNESLTLELHLLVTNVFMRKVNGKIDKSTLSNLEYVLKNSSNLSFANFLIKEFILKNQFNKE